jgi:hypothetical protein
MMLTLEALLKNEKHKKQKRVYGMPAGNFKK